MQTCTMVAMGTDQLMSCLIQWNHRTCQNLNPHLHRHLKEDLVDTKGGHVTQVRSVPWAYTSYTKNTSAEYYTGQLKGADTQRSN